MILKIIIEYDDSIISISKNSVLKSSSIISSKTGYIESFKYYKQKLSKSNCIYASKYELRKGTLKHLIGFPIMDRHGGKSDGDGILHYFDYISTFWNSARVVLTAVFTHERS